MRGSPLIVLSAALLAGACGDEMDTTPRTYEADDADLLYTGRIDFSNAKMPVAAYPGASVTARFRGVTVFVNLLDEYKWGKYRNYYDAVVDGVAQNKIEPEREDSGAPITRYLVAENLPYGEHEVTIVKRTEAAVGRTTFLGLEIHGQMLPPPARPTRRIEFIGDSITCGSGDEADNDSPQCQEDEWGQPYHNVYRAYGPVLARSLEAEAHVAGVSGIGLMRNYSNQYDARTMTDVYDLMFPETPVTTTAWDHTRYLPDVVVIALGTNDYSPGDMADATQPYPHPRIEPATFAASYIAFVTKLRGYYPGAQIFTLSSPMLGDGWPAATDTNATDLKDALTMVEDHFTAASDTKVHKFFVTKISGSGCGTHPSADQQAAMGAEIGAFVKSVMQW